MHLMKSAKKVSYSILGLLLTGGVAVLSLTGPTNTSDYEQDIQPAVSMISSQVPDSKTESEIQLEAKNIKYEYERRLKEIQAIYEEAERVKTAASPVTHENEKLLAPASAPAQTAKTVQPFKLPSSDEKPSSYWFVNANTLNVRKGNGTEYEKITSLKRGDKVGLYRKEGEWAVIRTESGKVGCILAKYLVDNEKSVSRATSSALSNEVTPLAQQIVEYSKTLQGVKYVYGGYSTKGFDCSGFTKYVYAHFGINVPRSSSEYAGFGVKVSRENLRPSDILLFDADGGSFNVTHVGIYLGGDKFIHASTSKGKVVIASFSGYGERYYGARRAIK